MKVIAMEIKKFPLAKMKKDDLIKKCAVKKRVSELIRIAPHKN